MDLTRDRGRRAWLEEVEMLERRRTRRPWQAIRPGVRSSKLDVFIIFSFTSLQDGFGHEGAG